MVYFCTPFELWKQATRLLLTGGMLPKYACFKHASIKTVLDVQEIFSHWRRQTSHVVTLCFCNRTQSLHHTVQRREPWEDDHSNRYVYT